ncbi:DUF2750 domain-containing protein [Pseudoalteromonas luteoviolacea]|uniref:DUF2750 domain-containing protein n=1 Tax=Pseudoalteromonas luteoviolacea TaxID=43657 RepID=UPI00114D56D4|nr:DUF2750 domain-containing protein [Pseudoalteromonas luteoviolacea]TQF70134.1 DUF2750 domain-containing protein [Pseudoalteromonas luteoviolacea]
MGQSASQAAAFYKEVGSSGKLWTCKDAGGIPAPINSNGQRAMPFWSSLSRVQKIIDTVSDYRKFEPYELTWSVFVTDWAPGLKKDGLLVGINWSGIYATGYDLDVSDVIANTSYHAKKFT